MIALLGSSGDKLAKSMGRSDGHMPMYTHMPGDFVPCDECQERGVCLYEVDVYPISERTKTTGRLWLLTDDGLRRLMTGVIDADDKTKQKIIDNMLKARYDFVPTQIGNIIQHEFEVMQQQQQGA